MLGKLEGGGIGHACQGGVEVVLGTKKCYRQDRYMSAKPRRDNDSTNIDR